MSSAATTTDPSKPAGGTWIERFCSMDGNEYLCKVDRDYIIDKFNLTGLEETVPFYRQSCDIIVDKIDQEMLDQLLASDTDEDEYCETQDKILSSAEMLYGLIHARYIVTDAGLAKMREKYLAGQFGKCTRYYCEQASMLPIGLSDEPSKQPVRLYCPRCMDIFVPHLSISSKYIAIDGAYFGTNFPHMFFMVYPEARPPKPLAHFVPSLYGFQIHSTAYEHQQAVSSASKKPCPMVVGRTAAAAGADGVRCAASNGDMAAAAVNNTSNTPAAASSTAGLNAHHRQQNHNNSSAATKPATPLSKRKKEAIAAAAGASEQTHIP